MIIVCEHVIFCWLQTDLVETIRVIHGRRDLNDLAP